MEITREQRQEIVRQIGQNIWSISGGRVGATPSGVVLPCGYGYRVEIDLHPSDTYIVRRVFERGGKRWVKGQVRDVYNTEVAETAYRAGMFRDKWPEGEVEMTYPRGARA